MGFIHANMIPLLKQGARKPFGGKLLLLGQGDIYFDLATLRRMATSAGFQLKEPVPFEPSIIPSFAAKGYPNAQTVFKMLGFDSVSALDYSEFEGADVIFDLNEELPAELRGQYDMVIDHGTLEHVFDFPNALNNVFKLLKVGGRVHFSVPSGNFFDHGFYMFQPTLFSDWLTANHWQIDAIQIGQYTPNQETEPAFFADYVPGMFESVSYGRLDNKLYVTQSSATKTSESTGDIRPQQGAYARLKGWQNVEPVQESQTEASHPAQPVVVSPPPSRRLVPRAYAKLKRMLP